MRYTESSLSRLNKDGLIRVALDRHNSTLYTKAILTDIKNEFSKLRKSYNPTGTPRRIHVDSTRILRRYVEDQISTNFHVISTYFFDVILLVEKSTWFPCIFFNVISLVEKSTLFPRIFFRCNFDGRKTHVVSTYFYRCNFDGRSKHVVFTYFFRCNFDGQRFNNVFGKL